MPHEPSNWDEIDAEKRVDENKLAHSLASKPSLSTEQAETAVIRARELVKSAREKRARKGMMESFLEEFGLSNSEGIALMCLAEALIRIPDAETRDTLIAEKIRLGDWAAHLNQSESWLVNVSTIGLLMTGQVIGPPKAALEGPTGFIQTLIRESGEPVIRAAMSQAMKIMGEQFVLGRNIKAAQKRASKIIKAGDAANFSFDMLGEGARTQADADRYFTAYSDAIQTLAQKDADKRPEDKDGISVKLSALHPRYEEAQRTRAHEELYPRLLQLASLAKDANLNFCIDAEEADRLVLQMELFERLAREDTLRDWSGLGLAVQAYQKRAGVLLNQLIMLAKDTNRRFMVRLVKGAYWDTEIKHTQVEGYKDYPVFTTKTATDVHYLMCARKLLNAGSEIYAQFATHNAHSLTSIRIMAEELGVSDFEFQRLHGMGEALYRAADANTQVRVYAPVGAHKDLLPYLVRRLLENGANSSFVNSFLDDDVAIDEFIKDPIQELTDKSKRNVLIPTPENMFCEERKNSAGRDLTTRSTRTLIENIAETKIKKETFSAAPIINGDVKTGTGVPVVCPHDNTVELGEVTWATTSDVDEAFKCAVSAQPEWDNQGGKSRANILRAMGDALESDLDFFVGLMSREGGKTLKDGIDEVREAVDFCRYYAGEAEKHFDRPARLPGPAGETNELSLHGRGVFVCISPWNFPLAIFTGQIAAALAAGNSVIAKPAEQTSIVAFEAVKRFLAAGLPPGVLHLLPGNGATIGAALTKHKDVAGVCFTGSTEVARLINQSLAARDSAIIPLIAETGGMNAMFVDTTALREQVLDDVVLSAFGSAGQRCSALRICFLPEDTADDLINDLKGVMAELTLDDPGLASTDIDPIIDAEARNGLVEYLNSLGPEAQIHYRSPAENLPEKQSFFAPTLIELPNLDSMTREIFGPVLHVIRYDPNNLGPVCDMLNAKGYGLTLGIHSRLDGFAEDVRSRVKVGNTYVNRSMTGAVVGVQPFGGEGLSGTGPKAGGPHYLFRFATERTVTVNTSAQGGDPELLNLG